MKHLKSLNEALPIFKALSAPMRSRIMEILYQDKDIHLDELAKKLGLTNSAISLHTKVLCDAGLIQIQSVPGKRGSMKICKPTCSSLLVDMKPQQESRSFYSDELPVGGYSYCTAAPTCGIATPSGIIGEFDNPRYFLFPEHFEAGIFWFASGEVEYMLPNHLKAGEQITELKISLEISSESPGYNEDYPSDIEFFLNDVYLGRWISPGDYGKRKGQFTPDWWPRHCNQYGLLKSLSVNNEGTFIDEGHRISSVTLQDLAITYNSVLRFRIQVRPDAANCGGLTLFGKGFGDYEQNILLYTYYLKI